MEEYRHRDGCWLRGAKSRPPCLDMAAVDRVGLKRLARLLVALATRAAARRDIAATAKEASQPGQRGD